VQNEINVLELSSNHGG